MTLLFLILTLFFFFDGSCFLSPSGTRIAGYALCFPHAVLEASFLPQVFSAQVTELVTLTRACHLAAGKTANIYIDSRYAFGVAHDFGQIWSLRSFLTSSGTPIR